MTKGQSISEAGAKGSRQRHITPESFASLLAALGDTPPGGARYEQLRAKLIFFFSRRLLAFPEDLADEVLDRLAYRLSQHTAIASAEAFALGIARHVAQEQSGRKSQPQNVDHTFFDNVSAPTVTLSNEEQEEEIVRMEHCLKKLPSSEARLLKGYYCAAGNSQIKARKSLAETLGISPIALRQRVFLARQRLRNCMTAAQDKNRK
jgi:DNA-directed RNA polymerase specialized sigma24 family protein